MAIQRMLSVVAASVLLVTLSGCMTTGYNFAKDPNMVRKWDVTIVTIESQNIYNSIGVAWVGPLATVEAVGQKVTILDATGKKSTFVQPKSKDYELHAGEKVVYIIDHSQVWVQPVDYPLPPEFTASPKQVVAPVAAAPQVVPVAAPADVKPEVKTLAASNPVPVQYKNATEKLRELNALFKEGLIEKPEYEERKKAILDAM